MYGYADYFYDCSENACPHLINIQIHCLYTSWMHTATITHTLY